MRKINFLLQRITLNDFAPSNNITHQNCIFQKPAYFLDEHNAKSKLFRATFSMILLNLFKSQIKGSSNYKESFYCKKRDPENYMT